jgi:hypothetical protein
LGGGGGLVVVGWRESAETDGGGFDARRGDGETRVSLSLKEMDQDNIARLPSVYNSLPSNAFRFLQVETFFFRGRETSAIRWLVQKKNPVAQSGGTASFQRKKIIFLIS